MNRISQNILHLLKHVIFSFIFVLSFSIADIYSKLLAVGMIELIQYCLNNKHEVFENTKEFFLMNFNLSQYTFLISDFFSKDWEYSPENHSYFILYLLKNFVNDFSHVFVFLNSIFLDFWYFHKDLFT